MAVGTDIGDALKTRENSARKTSHQVFKVWRPPIQRKIGTSTLAPF
jgi:hypothetical protein